MRKTSSKGCLGIIAVAFLFGVMIKSCFNQTPNDIDTGTTQYNTAPASTTMPASSSEAEIQQYDTNNVGKKPKHTKAKYQENSNKESFISQPKEVRSPRNAKRKNSNMHQYIRGPRGGCYYINGNGNKTYVDRSLCD